MPADVADKPIGGTMESKGDRAIRAFADVAATGADQRRGKAAAVQEEDGLLAFGEAGLDALRAMLMHADHYGLKWVFVRDHYYDPLLSFAGWRPVDSLVDKTITVWSKDGVPPATPMNTSQIPAHWQGLLWGTLPFGSSILAILVLMIPQKKRAQRRVDRGAAAGETFVQGRLVS